MSFFERKTVKYFKQSFLVKQFFKLAEWGLRLVRFPIDKVMKPQSCHPGFFLHGSATVRMTTTTSSYDQIFFF
jgi:hypothetical protein